MDEGSNHDAEDAFSVLSDETRLAILRELADAADESIALLTEPLSYSELMDRVGVRDSGNFNYHLDALRDRFVGKVEGGYRIRRAGLDVVRALRAGNVASGSPVERTAVDESCPYCAAPVEAFVEDDWLYGVCTGCPGSVDGPPGLSEGLLTAQEVSPASQRDRSVAELFEAVHVAARRRIQMAFDGVCPECTGAVEGDLDVCVDHDTGDGRSCDRCGRPRPAMVRFECRICGYTSVVEPAFVLWDHHPTRAALLDAGVDLGGSVWSESTAFAGWEYAVHADGETLLRYRVPLGDAHLRVTIDGDLAVRSVERQLEPA